MRSDLSADQELFRETTSRFLDEFVSPAQLRSLRDDPVGFDLTHWRRGVELGWTSLLVAESFGGGSISEHGLVDLTLVAHEFGMHAASGPLVSANVVAATLSDAGSHRDVLEGLLSGAAMATWCHATPSVDIVIAGTDIILSGVLRPVQSANVADYLLVTGRTDAGLSQVLVPRELAGVSLAPMKSVDLTQRFSVVSFDNVRVPHDAVVGELGNAEAMVRRQSLIAGVVACAESVGAMQHAFDITVEWAFDRYSFGRPLASYQALKHRYADMKAWLEASHAIADAAALAVASEAPEAAEMVSIAIAFIGDYGSELLQDCVQLHGGLGVTFEHDIHLFLRRHTINRTLYGTPAEHRQLIADAVQSREAAA